MSELDETQRALEGASALDTLNLEVFKLAWVQRERKFDARLASLAKLHCAEKAVRVALDAIQIHGGAGYMAELPFEKLARDAKMVEIGGARTRFSSKRLRDPS